MDERIENLNEAIMLLTNSLTLLMDVQRGARNEDRAEVTILNQNTWAIEAINAAARK